MSNANFQPPAFEPPKVQPWATYIHDRRPPFKVHAERSRAFAAVNLVDNWDGTRGRDITKRGGVVYMLCGVPPTWTEYETVERA